MILSNVAIQDALDSRRLILEPEPAPRRAGEGVVKCPYDTTSVDLRMGDEISIPTHIQPTAVDLRSGKFSNLQDWRSQKITEQTPYVLAPWEFVLAQTFEKVSLPIREDDALAARVEGKSSFARCGMLVHFTAPTIHAGFSGPIALEIINLGPKPILLYPKMYVCQLILEEVKGVPFRNDSQFQNQVNPTGARKRVVKKKGSK